MKKNAKYKKPRNGKKRIVGLVLFFSLFISGIGLAIVPTTRNWIVNTSVAVYELFTGKTAERIEDLEGQVLKLTADKNALILTLEQKDSELLAKQNLLEEKNTLITTKNIKISSLQDEIVLLETDIETMETELAQLRLDALGNGLTISFLESKLQLAYSAVNQINGEKLELENEVFDLQNEVNELTTAIISYEEQISFLNSEIQRLLALIEEMQQTPLEKAFANYEYELNTSLYYGHVKITAYTGPTGVDLIIPDYNDYVEDTFFTEIGDSAFYNKGLKSVIIPQNTISIGSWAFGKNELTEIVIPNLIDSTDFGYLAFAENKITNATLPTDWTTIPNGIFYSNQLSSIIIPNNVSDIGSQAFSYNLFTGELDLSHLAQLKKLSGFDNNEITSVVLPDGLLEIGGSAFANNLISGTLNLSNLTELTAVDGFSNNLITEVIFSNSIKEVLHSAFKNNRISNLTIPSSMKYIRSFAFADNELENIVIPTSLTTIGTGAFVNNLIAKITIPYSVSYANDTFDSGVEIIRE